MSISDADIKRLWGKAAGRCAFPTCEINCLPSLDLNNPTIVGEMAHAIARKSGGPRGRPTPGADSYTNLILFCPTHHTLVDKAPEGTFPAKTLLKWKADHERRIEASLTSPVFADRSQLDDFIRTNLIENHTCWSTYGPESDIAQKNPNSTAGLFWPFRKLSLIVPNNRHIISAIRSNSALLDTKEYRIACAFIEHAEGFERNCITPTENVPKFPVAFGSMFNEER